MSVYYMKLTSDEWYDLGCQFTVMSQKLEQLHTLLMIHYNENNYYVSLAEKTCECFDIALRNELISILFKAFPKSDYLPEYADLLLVDVFYHKLDLNQTINYGKISYTDKRYIVQLCNEVISYIDKIYLAYGNGPTPTPNRVIINLQRIVRGINKLH